MLGEEVSPHLMEPNLDLSFVPQSIDLVQAGTLGLSSQVGQVLALEDTLVVVFAEHDQLSDCPSSDR